jgi:hypothetical protein
MVDSQPADVLAMPVMALQRGLSRALLLAKELEHLRPEN